MRYTQVRKVFALAVITLAAMIFAQGVASAGELLTISVDSVDLPLDRVGEVKNKGDELEIKDRQYEGELGFFPTNINGTGFQADEIKVISDLKIRDSVGEHRGTIDIDIDSIPGGHITLEYRGTATRKLSTISSSGQFKVIRATGIFDAIRASGSYIMTIVESGNTLGSPATVTIFASGM